MSSLPLFACEQSSSEVVYSANFLDAQLSFLTYDFTACIDSLTHEINLLRSGLSTQQSDVSGVSQDAVTIRADLSTLLSDVSGV